MAPCSALSTLVYNVRSIPRMQATILLTTRTVQFARLPSIQGHDSFLVDMDRFRPVVAQFLDTLKLATA